MHKYLIRMKVCYGRDVKSCSFVGNFCILSSVLKGSRIYPLHLSYRVNCYFVNRVSSVYKVSCNFQRNVCSRSTCICYTRITLYKQLPLFLIETLKNLFSITISLKHNATFSSCFNVSPNQQSLMKIHYPSPLKGMKV